MWFGLMHAPTECNGPEVVVCAYEPDRIFTVGTQLEAAPHVLRLLHQAALESGGVESPQCRRCGKSLDVPPPHALEEP